LSHLVKISIVSHFPVMLCKHGRIIFDAAAAAAPSVNINIDTNTLPYRMMIKSKIIVCLLVLSRVMSRLLRQVGCDVCCKHQHVLLLMLLLCACNAPRSDNATSSSLSPVLLAGSRQVICIRLTLGHYQRARDFFDEFLNGN
jgi:hypothetical protein